MANARGKTVDTTFLSIDSAEERGFIHRDYIAHCFRWTYVARWLAKQKRYSTERIMDVGCGREIPLAKLLYTSKMQPKEGYVAIDYGPIEPPDWLVNQTKFPLILRSGQDFLMDLPEEKGKIGLITCFEVLEHVEPAHMLLMLQQMKTYLKEGGTVIFSTPNFDPQSGAAGNHVNEITYKFLEHCVKIAGYEIVARHGTFASQRDIKPRLEQDGYAKLFEDLRGYYDTNLLSTFFAPLYPAESRNCLWEIKPLSSWPQYEPFDMDGVIAGSSNSPEAWGKFYELAGSHFINIDKQVMYTEDKQSDDFMV